MLPKRIPREPKRASRWRSAAHCNWVRTHECCIPGCKGRPIEAAHVRNGSGAGTGQKPDDFRTVSLCKAHHDRQHSIGEETFWRGIDVEQLVEEFCIFSPKKAEIRRVKAERADAPPHH